MQSTGLFPAIIVSHLVVAVVMWAAARYTTLPKSGHLGLYFVLLPVGFNQFGAELPHLTVSAMVGLGVVWILLSLHRSPVSSESQPSATCSAPPPGDT